jgi:hypothetical protein
VRAGSMHGRRGLQGVQGGLWSVEASLSLVESPECEGKEIV